MTTLVIDTKTVIKVACKKLLLFIFFKELMQMLQFFLHVCSSHIIFLKLFVDLIFFCVFLISFKCSYVFKELIQLRYS